MRIGRFMHALQRSPYKARTGAATLERIGARALNLEPAVVSAVTFDLWDMLVVDDSDEAVREAQGLPTKAEARRLLFVNEVMAHTDISEEAATEAFNKANATFRHQWKVEHRTPHIAHRLKDGFDHLGIAPTPGFEAVVSAFSTMEVDIPPRATDGAQKCLEALHGKYPLAIVSDAIVTPGKNLRDLLAKHGLAKYFDHFVFSDEAGASKPDPKVFRLAAAGLDVDVKGIVHIGDREANDIAGPINAGALGGILYTGSIDRGREGTRALAVCEHLDDLPGIIAELDARG